MDLKSKITHQVKRLFRPERTVGIDIHINELGNEFTAIELSRKKNKIETSKSLGQFPDVESLVQSLDKNIPVYLSINGRGVLHKQLEPSQSKEQILQQILPNADPAQFVVQVTPAQQGIVASIARKEIITAFFSQLENMGLWVLGCSLGSFDSVYLLPLLSGRLSINTKNQKLTFNEQRKLIEFSNRIVQVDEPISLGDQNISTMHINAYAAAFKGMIQIPQNLQFDLIETNQQEFLHKKIFTYGSIVSAALILLCLLINTGIYYHYKGKNQSLGITMLSSATMLSELDSLKSHVSKQKSLLASTSINLQTKASYFADQIGASAPKDLQFTEVDIYPVKGKERDYNKEELIKYDRSKILIKGLCKNSLVYNQWIQDLEAFEWVSKANHLDYQDISEHLAEFELEIILNSSQ